MTAASSSLGSDPSQNAREEQRTSKRQGLSSDRPKEFTWKCPPCRRGRWEAEPCRGAKGLEALEWHRAQVDGAEGSHITACIWGRHLKAFSCSCPSWTLQISGEGLQFSQKLLHSCIKRAQFSPNLQWYFINTAPGFHFQFGHCPAVWSDKSLQPPVLLLTVYLQFRLPGAVTVHSSVSVQHLAQWGSCLQYSFVLSRLKSLVKLVLSPWCRKGEKTITT